MSFPTSSIGPLQLDPGSGLSYRLRLPQPARPRAMVVLLHGVGGQEMDLADLAAGVDPETLVVLVRSRIQLGPEQFGWFRVAFTAEGPKIAAGEAEDSRHALIRLVDHLQSQHSIEARRTVLAGFSQGGILSASCGPQRARARGRLRHPLGPHPAGARTPRRRPRVARAPAGLHRPWRAGPHPAPGLGPAGRQWLDDLGIPHVTRVYPAGHTLNPEMRADVLAWIGGLSGAA